MQAKKIPTYRYVLYGDTSTRLAKRKNEVEEQSLQQRKRSLEKQEKATFRQLHSLKKERYSHEFFNNLHKSRSKSVPESYKRKTCKFIEVPVDLADSKGKTDNLLTASSVERTITRFRRQSCCEEGQVVKVSMAPMLKDKVYKEPENERRNVPRKGRRHTISFLTFGSGDMSNEQRKLFEPEEKVDNFGECYRSSGDEELDEEEKLGMVDEQEQRSALDQQTDDQEIAVITKAISIIDTEKGKILLTPSATKKSCPLRRRFSIGSFPLRPLSCTEIDTTSSKMASSRHSSRPGSSTQKLAEPNNLIAPPELFVQNLVSEEDESGGESLNETVTNRFKQLSLETQNSQCRPPSSRNWPSKGCSYERRPKVTPGFQEDTAKEGQLAGKARRSWKLEQALIRSRQPRRCSLDLTSLSATEKTIAAQTMLRQLEIEQASLNARKLAQKRFGDAKADKETSRMRTSTFPAAAKGDSKSKNSLQSVHVEKVSFRETARRVMSASKAVKAWTSLKNNQTGRMDEALETLSKDLKDCRYLRCEALPRKRGKQNPGFRSMGNKSDPRASGQEYEISYLS